MKIRPIVLRKSGFPALFPAITRNTFRVLNRSLAKRVLHVMMALCMVLSCAGGASARTLTIQSFKAEITITPDGMVDVTETIQAHFAGAWNGLYRTVPIQ